MIFFEGVAPSSSNVSEGKAGTYTGAVAKPAEGFTAFFVELVYDSGSKYPFKFTTEVRVVPDVLPYKFVPKGKPQGKL